LKDFQFNNQSKKTAFKLFFIFVIIIVRISISEYENLKNCLRSNFGVQVALYQR